MAGRESDCSCEPGLIIPYKESYNLEFLRERFIEKYPHEVWDLHIRNGIETGGIKLESLMAESQQISSLDFLAKIGLGDAYRRITIGGIRLVLPQDAFPEQFGLKNGDYASKANGLKGTLQEQHLSEWSIQKDPEAFGQLYGMYSPDAYRYAYQKLGNIHDAEDLVNQAALQAWRAIDRFVLNKAINKPFGAWFGQIVHNLVVDHYRDKGRYRDYTLNSQIPAGDEVNPQAWVERKFTIEELRKGLTKLKSLYGQIILMKFRDNLSYSEIASALHEEAGTVRVQMHRALKELGRLSPTLSVRN